MASSRLGRPAESRPGGCWRESEPDFAPETLVRDLSMPQQQLVEIAKALGLSAKVLILDEPTASLTGREVDRLLETAARALRAAGDQESCTSRTGSMKCSRRPIGHGVARWPSCRDARYYEFGSLSLIRSDGGARDEREYPVPGLSAIGACSRPADWVVGNGREGCFLAVHAGEILGIAGLVGSGRTELAQILFGLTPADSGQILLNGKPVAIRSPQQAVRLGIAYTPEDRKRQGAILPMRIAANTSLASLPTVSASGWIVDGREASLARELNERLDTKATSVHTMTRDLSGGNQQKVVLARWLATSPR